MPVMMTFSTIRRRTSMPEMKATIAETATIITPPVSPAGNTLPAPNAPLGGDHHVLVLELVLQHLPHGGAQRRVAVALPDVEVLLDAVDLDRLEHHVDGRRAEEAAHGDDERELETAPRVERRDVLETEELLPEGDVARLDRDEGIEDRLHARRRDLAQRAIEGEVEDLVEDEAAPEPCVGRHRIPQDSFAPDARQC